MDADGAIDVDEDAPAAEPVPTPVPAPEFGPSAGVKRAEPEPSSSSSSSSSSSASTSAVKKPTLQAQCWRSSAMDEDGFVLDSSGVRLFERSRRQAHEK